MKPKRIRITKTVSPFFTKGKIYEVDDWLGDKPSIEDDDGCFLAIDQSKWEPVQDFKHGDPVWAYGESPSKVEGKYLCPTLDGVNHYVKVNNLDRPLEFIHVEHIKPTITIKELAQRADIDLDEYEVVE